MFLKKFELFNYKSYIDSKLLEFTPGINIIIGQNNSGKTALLEALTLKLLSNPHRSTKTVPTRFSKTKEESYAYITLSIEKHELRRFFEQLPPPLGCPEPGFEWWNGEPEEAQRLIESFQKWLDEPTSVELSLNLSSNPQAEVERGKITPSLTFNFHSYSDLPKFDENEQYLYISFSENQDGNISADLIHEYEVEIRLWTIEAAREGREDLTFPLSACGSGISQVLAILYVVITSQLPRTIIIDEPQSFLHPGAAKKLVEILKGFPQHQYFIATHSPMLITAAHPSRIIKLVHDGCQTKASIINTEETAEQQSILSEVGVRLSDVFGADDILWVEGPTEEQCFPLILEKVAKKSLKGTVILAVKDVGDLEQRNRIKASIIFEIYDKLSRGKSLFPPAIGFVFDREGRTPQEIDDLKRRSSNSIEFLPRRMYENYLLIPEAIAAVINNNDQLREVPLMDTEVHEWIEQRRQDREYLKGIHNNENLSETEWLEKVDASKLLNDLFAKLSEARVKFSKPKHPYELSVWLVEHKPEHFSNLAEFLKAKLNKEKTNQGYSVE